METGYDKNGKRKKENAWKRGLFDRGFKQYCELNRQEMSREDVFKHINGASPLHYDLGSDESNRYVIDYIVRMGQRSMGITPKGETVYSGKRPNKFNAEGL